MDAPGHARCPTPAGVHRLRAQDWPAGVRLLVLHGSRARGEAADTADWDLGILADGDVDLPRLLDTATRVLGTDAVDLVDLRTASALLRFRAARDGIALVEREASGFLDFREEAVRFWCDAGPVIRAAQDDVLAGLG